MNPEVSDKLAHLLDWLGNVVNDADTFARAQLPEVAREIVAWELWSSVGWGSLFAIIVVACIVSVVVMLKKTSGMNTGDRMEAIGPFVVPIAVLAAISMMFVAGFANDASRAVIAPRVVIIDYIRKHR